MSDSKCIVRGCDEHLPPGPVMPLCHGHLMKWRQIQIREKRINIYDREGTGRFIRFKTEGN
jgi:hypothetical protein